MGADIERRKKSGEPQQCRLATEWTDANTHTHRFSYSMHPLLARRIDDEIYVDFMSTFGPNVPRIDILDEAKDFKSPEMKEKWRNFINRYEGGKVTDYNFGSLLRIDASKEYSEDNTMFGKFFTRSANRRTKMEEEG